MAEKKGFSSLYLTGATGAVKNTDTLLYGETMLSSGIK